MVRAAIGVTDGAIPASVIEDLVDLGREMLTEPVGASSTLATGPTLALVTPSLVPRPSV